MIVADIYLGILRSALVYRGAFVRPSIQYYLPAVHKS
jgi:hypothetical protein